MGEVLTESPDCHVTMYDIHLQGLLWIYCPVLAKGSDQADRHVLGKKATIASGFCLRSSEELETVPEGHKPKDITPID